MSDSPAQPVISPAPIRMGVLALCALVAVSTLPWLWMALGEFGGFAWGLFGFELIALMGCLLTALVCLGRVKINGAMPLAIACLAGTLLVGVVFGLYVDGRAVIGDNPTLRPWITNTVLLRVGVIGLLALLATLDVYRRDARTWGLVLRAAVFLVPVLAILAWFRLKGLPAVANEAGEMSPVRMVLVIVGGLVFGILLSIGGHFLIRSFEVALPEKTTPDGA